MDTSLAIVGIVLLALAIGPIIALSVYNKYQHQKRQNELKQLEKKLGLGFGKSEFYKKRFFGLDEKRLVFIFAKYSGKELSYELVDLKTMKECKMLKAAKDQDDEGCELHFFSSRSGIKAVSLFDTQEDNYLNLSGLQQTAKRWCETLNSAIAAQVTRLPAKESAPRQPKPFSKAS